MVIKSGKGGKEMLRLDYEALASSSKTLSQQGDIFEDCITTMNSNGIDLTDPETYDWVMTIPQDEINNNPYINEGDQNP